VVEDDADVRSYVVETLSVLGYDVLEAGGGDEALSRLEEYQSVRLLLTDVVRAGSTPAWRCCRSRSAASHSPPPCARHWMLHDPQRAD
jgi:CheY-like chemotaxis protein